MESNLAFHLFALTQGIAFLAILQLFTDQKNIKTRWQMAGCITTLCLISLAPMSVFYDENNIGIAIALVLIGFLSIGPLLWLLVVKLTIVQPHHPKKSLVLHLMIPLVATVTSLWILLLPRQQQISLFLHETHDTGSVHHLLLPILFALFILWLFQSAWYLLAITRQLLHYREHLRRYFSNTEKRDLAWIHWFGGTLIISWLLLAISHFLVFDTSQLLTMEIGALLILCVLLVLVINGQGQKPGFDSLSETDQDIASLLSSEADVPEPGAKYTNSALSREDLQRYSTRIEEWINTEKGYLDPDLTMPGMAKQVGISPWYISQTLSESFGTNFYDYINQKRLNFACSRLLATTESVLDIAMMAGFNSRSSFYNAFKKHKGITPGQFRTRNRGAKSGI